MRKKKLIALILVMLSVFSIISISNKIKSYTSKPFQMIYLMQDGESCESVARRFGVKVEDLKLDGRYVMFEVR